MPQSIKDFYERPSFLNARSLVGTKSFVIKSANSERIRDQIKLVLRFEEISNPFIVNKTNAEILATKFGPSVDGLIGKRIALVALPTTYKGEPVMGLRVVDPPAEHAELVSPSLADWERHIDNYIARGWRLIPLPKHSKKPYPGEFWTEQQFDRNSILENVTHGGNVAAEAGTSNIAILDLDSNKMPSVLDPFLTLSQKTARGFQFVTGLPFDQNLFDRLKQVVPELDTPRMGAMYAVLPLSQTCANDHGNKDVCRVHDLRVRTWIGAGLEASVLPFPEFAKVVLR